MKCTTERPKASDDFFPFELATNLGRTTVRPKRRKPMLAVALASLVLLTSCSAPQIAPSPETVTPSPSATNTASVQSDDGIPDFVLTLVADQTTALLNGEEAILTAAPYVSGYTFYFPLADVVTLLGGSFVLQGEMASVQLFGHSASFQVGQTAVEVDGASYEIPEIRDGFRLSQEDSPLAVAEEYGPVITAGTFYVPSDLIPAQCPSFGLNNLLEYPQTNMIIIGRIEREFGFDDIRLYDIFADLPEEVRSQYDLAGSAGHVLNYSISEYQSETTHVYVMNVDEGTEDVEQMDGRICAIYVDSPGPQTPRGLQVGEGIDRAWLLYGHASMTNSFRYTVSGSFITSLSFCTRYFSI